jgi:putative transposase
MGMPRAPRIEFEGAIYHVMSRGNHLDPIFKDDEDRKLLLKTLGEAAQSSDWQVHSFVFMRNHYHLLIETRRKTLVKGMQYLNSTYTRRYNVRHKTFGHLLQGRYKALLVDVENPGYFLTVSDYIHMNPVRIKGDSRVRSVEELLKNPWSSAGWLSGTQRGKPGWLGWERAYGELGLERWNGRSRKQYRQYLERRIEEVGVPEEKERHRKIQRGWCLGSVGFVEEMKEKLAKLREKPLDRESWNDVAMEELEQDRAGRMIGKAMKCLGCRGNEVTGWDRLLLARKVREHSKVSVKWLAEQLGMKTRGGMSNGIYLVGQKVLKDRAFAARWRKLENIV